MGSSRPWPEVMKVMTGQEKMDATAIRDYFAPLEKWLTAKNVELGETIGWKNWWMTTFAIVFNSSRCVFLFL